MVALHAFGSMARLWCSDMATIKTSELSGAALDWAVATLEKLPVRRYPMGPGTVPYWVFDDAYPPKVPYQAIGKSYSPSANWDQGGPIIEREGVGIWPSEREGNKGQWGARMLNTHIAYGPTPLVAAMRCFVASKLGDQVDVPDELV